MPARSSASPGSPPPASSPAKPKPKRTRSSSPVAFFTYPSSSPALPPPSKSSTFILDTLLDFTSSAKSTSSAMSTKTGSSHGSSTIKASRSLFRFRNNKSPSLPDESEDMQPKKKKRPVDAVTYSSGRGGFGNIKSSSNAQQAASRLAQAKAQIEAERRGSTPDVAATAFATLSPAAQYRLLQQASLEVQAAMLASGNTSPTSSTFSDKAPHPPHFPYPPQHPYGQPPPHVLATASSLALQDLMTPQPHLRHGSSPLPSVMSVATTSEADDNSFMQELEAAAEDSVPAWLSLDRGGAALASPEVMSPDRSVVPSPVASSYLSAFLEDGEDHIYGDDESDGEGGTHNTAQYPTIYEAWSDEEEHHESSTSGGNSQLGYLAAPIPQTSYSQRSRSQSSSDPRRDVLPSPPSSMISLPSMKASSSHSHHRLPPRPSSRTSELTTNSSLRSGYPNSDTMSRRTSSTSMSIHSSRSSSHRQHHVPALSPPPPIEPAVDLQKRELERRVRELEREAKEREAKLSGLINLVDQLRVGEPSSGTK